MPSLAIIYRSDGDVLTSVASLQYAGPPAEADGNHPFRPGPKQIPWVR